MTAHLERLAFHEAGHVVAALILGRHFDYVTIVDDGDVPAHTKFIDSPLQQDRSDPITRRYAIETEIIVTLAGVAVEALMWPSNSPQFGHRDLDSAEQLALDITDSDTECQAFLVWLTERTKNMLSTPTAWAAIGRVAKLLLEQETLTSKALAHHLDFHTLR